MGEEKIKTWQTHQRAGKKEKKKEKRIKSFLVRREKFKWQVWEEER